MERNGNIAPPESPPAAAPPAANDTHPGSPRAEPTASLPALSPAGEAEDAAYWRGYHAALAAAAEPAADDTASPRVRRLRIDGFSGEKQAVFLEGIAAGLTVVEAAKAARISVTTVYNFRNRRAGRAFNIAWEAADRRARRPLADNFRDRSLAGQTETIRGEDEKILATKHRFDNRLGMAVLTRLDKKAAAYKDDERLVTAVAEEFEELLDCIEEGGDAEAFIEARRPPSVEYRPAAGSAESEAAFIARYTRFHHFDSVDPDEIDVSDLDPGKREDWTDDQWDRAEASGFLDRLPPEEDDEGEESDAPEPDDETR